MTRTLFTADWTFRRVAEAGDIAAYPVRLPHDAMLVEGRNPDAASGPHGSHFLGGEYVYSKRWTAPNDHSNSRFSVFFEGVQGITRVVVNGTDIGGAVNGYTEFEVSLDAALVPGENLIEVHVDNTGQPNSRWYTGSGIYRPVWLVERRVASFAFDGVRFVNHIREGSVELSLAFELGGAAPEGSEVHLTIFDGEEHVADAATGTHHRQVSVVIDQARLWSAEDPHRYRADVQLVAPDGAVLDTESVLIGLRTVEVRPGTGLLINGAPTLLKGACVHHDSGILGAATFRAAEFRRARILKENGFNAIRSAHNPLSRDMLDACDELGLYVMDELTDVWMAKKTMYDGAQFFLEQWRTDLTAMIAKDRNHPSVIMYSIGNEIADTATADGIQITEQMSSLAHRLDATRPVTEAINFLVNVMASFNASPFDAAGKREEKAKAKADAAKPTSTAANAITNKIGSIMGLISRLPRADKASRDSFAHVDVAGYNYAASRYAGDAKRYPGRIIVGSETMPGDIAKNWAQVEKLPNVIGDFMWTGWDYLGEAGLGEWIYGKGEPSMNRPYPHITAGAGIIDITGVPGAPTLLTRAVWGDLDGPGIAVRPLDHAGETVARSAWRSTDAVPSWAWHGKAGTLAAIEVYSDADSVELLLNGRSLGRKRTGAHAGFVARYSVAYEPGEIVAIDHLQGIERQTILRSADTHVGLFLTAERLVLNADGDDLAFVKLEAVDASGVIEMLADDDVRIEVAGPGTLAGFGSAAPAGPGSYLDDRARLRYGRALAVVRAGDRPGTITVTATSRTLGTAALELTVTPHTRTSPRRSRARSDTSA